MPALGRLANCMRFVSCAHLNSFLFPVRIKTQSSTLHNTHNTGFHLVQERLVPTPPPSLQLAHRRPPPIQLTIPPPLPCPQPQLEHRWT